jgi:hypothetical protein
VKMQLSLPWVTLGAFLCLQVALGQTAAQPKPAPRLALWVTSTAWPDGGEIPMKYSVRGENKSPAFEFHWKLGTNPTSAPARKRRRSEPILRLRLLHSCARCLGINELFASLSIAHFGAFETGDDVPTLPSPTVPSRAVPRCWVPGRG